MYLLLWYFEYCWYIIREGYLVSRDIWQWYKLFCNYQGVYTHTLVETGENRQFWIYAVMHISRDSFFLHDTLFWVVSKFEVKMIELLLLSGIHTYINVNRGKMATLNFTNYAYFPCLLVFYFFDVLLQFRVQVKSSSASLAYIYW